MAKNKMTAPFPTHGGQLRAIASQYGVAEENLLDFSANLHPGGPPSAVMDALQAAMRRPQVITSYPDLEHSELKVSIGKRIHVPIENIAIANGFVPLLEAFIDALHIRRCLLPVPAFLEYQRVLSQHDVKTFPIPLREERLFAYEIDMLLREAIDKQADAILLANPQNPSGVLTPALRLTELAAEAARHGIHILLDEAFIDYAPNGSLSALTAHAKNLTVFRSVTKFYAMPGLRVAYALSNPSLVATACNRIAPWPVSTMASIAVAAAFTDEEFARQALAQNVEARLRLVDGLVELGHKVFPSAANFVLIRLSESIASDRFWEQMITEHRIVLRACANYMGLDTRYYRIAVRSMSDNLRLLQAFQCFTVTNAR